MQSSPDLLLAWLNVSVWTIPFGMATVLLLLFTTLVLLPVVVIVVDVIVVFCSCCFVLRKKPIDRVMLSSALHRNLCPMPLHTHVYIPTLLHSVQGMGEFFKEIHSLARPGQGRAVLAAFLSFLLSFLIIFLDVFPAFPQLLFFLLLLFTKKSAHTLTHAYTLRPPPTPHCLACCFAIPLKVTAFSSYSPSHTHSQSVNLCLCWKFESALLLLCFPL